MYSGRTISIDTQVLRLGETFKQDIVAYNGSPVLVEVITHETGDGNSWRHVNVRGFMGRKSNGEISYTLIPNCERPLLTSHIKEIYPQLYNVLFFEG